MNRILIVSLLYVLGLSACTPENAQTGAAAGAEAPAPPATQISFKETEVSLGQVKEGALARHRFTFTNSGDKPLTILNVKPSCGCTAPSWTKEAIAPGAEGFIDVEFNSRGRSGIQKKSITVLANTTPPNHTLSFTAEVVAAQ